MLQRSTSISSLYRDRARQAGGSWYALIAGPDGPIVDNAADHVTEGYSVQTLAVAVAVLEKVDRGGLSLGQRLALTADDILGGSGLCDAPSQTRNLWPLPG
jgi:beta-lactamase class A